ncbi:hypothetical protein MW887_002753 [Aspergillus wentii]|nr:hypothetical protein MW887_002753 [Aspergillus wentii]
MERDHCGEGCQSNCHKVEPKIVCEHNSTRSVAYYESWATTRACDKYQPEDIDVSEWTHINFAFAIIGDDSKVALSSPDDVDLYKRFVGLKENNTELEVWLAVGGYGVGSKPFSKMSDSNDTRKGFIDSCLDYMDKYGFDGIDVDWEYPAASEMGGTEADTKNFVTLVKEMKEAFKEKGKGLSITIPGGAYFLKGFDLEKMEPYIDMINIMSYDLHGPWDQPLKALPHTNITEINTSLQLLWNEGIPTEKVNLGLAYYGHSFTLKSKDCAEPGCAATAGGEAGPCSGAKGVLNNAEIEDILQKRNVTATLDKDATIKYASWDETQWVSYDDDETFKLKRDFAKSKCLGGSFVWAVDMEPKKDSNSTTKH